MIEIFRLLDEIEKTQGNINKMNKLTDLFINYSEVEEFFRILYNDDKYGLSKQSIINITGYDRNKDGLFDDAGLIAAHFSSNEINSVNIFEIRKILDIVKQKSGNDLLDYVRNNILVFDGLITKWIIRLIMKDLRLGIELKTVNKIFKQLNLKLIEKFAVQLCGKFDNIEDVNLDYPVYCGIKYDGFRCVAFKEGNNIELISRQGKDVTSFLPEIVEALKTYNANFVLDGEIMANNFNEISKRIGRKVENIEPIKNIHYRVFDILYFQDNEIQRSFRELPQYQRKQFLDRFPIEHTEFVKLEEGKKILNQAELFDFYKMACDRKEEGIIIKDLNKPYEYNSRNNWFKVKPIFENSFKVTGFEYGSGKLSETIGNLVVTDNDNIMRIGVGSGLTDDIRAQLLDLMMNDKLIGLIIDVRYNEISKNNKGEYSLRFPRFLAIRHDKDKADSLNLIYKTSNTTAQFNLNDF
jgi:ATP-dependent DNA ligase